MRPAGGAPAWKRQRERLAARIEALEGELDRHQTAMHRLDERTGLTYRTLFAELIGLEAGRPKPLSLPGLRSLLSELHPADVATIEESCAPLARYWLPANFEDSPTVRAEYFQSGPRLARHLHPHLQEPHRGEAQRGNVNAETLDFFRIENPILNSLLAYEV